MRSEQIKEFEYAYIEALFWADVDDNGELKNLELSVSAKDKIKKDCKDFLSKIPENLLDNFDLSQLGHDFWLTRQGHGAGFWDGDYSKSDEELLMQLVKPFKEVELYANYGFLQIN
jgi:hypothetical protein